MLSHRKLESFHELIEQALIHPANYYQQIIVIVHAEKGKYIPTFIAIVLQLQHI